ncbi:hypothetical protein RF11_10462 [Thelohanellus kitauei]|uniref:Uncharacterized protein n=1 Tax=Thelohanellus kitauei TaxID=669202 RepID=A0A0C2NMC6_THEKT|nr:hypothetical protein RF11_10462 [Thelohanellus kitauei]
MSRNYSVACTMSCEGMVNFRISVRAYNTELFLDHLFGANSRSTDELVLSIEASITNLTSNDCLGFYRHMESCLPDCIQRKTRNVDMIGLPLKFLSSNNENLIFEVSFFVTNYQINKEADSNHDQFLVCKQNNTWKFKSDTCKFKSKGRHLKYDIEETPRAK